MNILLVDDHQTFLAGTALILEKHGFTVTTAASGPQAIEKVRTGESYDLFIFDLKLPGMNGFELTKNVLELKPDAIIVILTGEDVSDHYDELIEAGVCGIIEKSLGELEFISSLILASKGLVTLPLALARKLRTKGTDSSSQAHSRTLTDKETSVLKLIAKGCKNKDIADQLFMSQRNVEYVISHLFEKLQADSRQDAVMKAIAMNVIKLDV